MRNVFFAFATIVTIIGCSADKNNGKSKTPAPDSSKTPDDLSTGNIESGNSMGTEVANGGDMANFIEFYATLSCGEAMKTKSYTKLENYEFKATLDLENNDKNWVVKEGVGSIKQFFGDAAANSPAPIDTISYRCEAGTLALDFAFSGKDASVKPSASIEIPCSEINKDLLDAKNQKKGSIGYNLEIECNLANDSLSIKGRSLYLP